MKPKINYDENLKQFIERSNDGVDAFVFKDKFLVIVNPYSEIHRDKNAEGDRRFLCDIATFVKKNGQWVNEVYDYIFKIMTESEVNKYLQSVLTNS